MIERLSKRFGFAGSVLDWFRSYLQGRSHVVKIENALSEPVDDACGVPQGSVIGPILFTLYVAPIHDIIRAHGFNSMLYADDTQVYTVFDPIDRDNAIFRMNNCLQDIRTWAARNKLTLNDSKTEMVHFTSKFLPRQNPNLNVHVGGKEIASSMVVRNLGAMMDQHLTMKTHINKTCQSAMGAIRKIGQIRDHLDQRTTEMLVHAFVTSRLDTCNALLCGLPELEIKKLQRIQNIAARIVVRARSHEHITPILSRLHWLQIHQRIRFKVLLLVYKVLNGGAPSYLSDIIKEYVPARKLRSMDSNQLQMSKTNTKYYGDRALSVIAPTMWNSLPSHIRNAPSVTSFKQALKTYMCSSNM